jgi:hypothetical protein
LILAFGLARVGDPDAAKQFLKEATSILERGDPAHRCLSSLYRHRIEQVLAGKRPVGPLPAGLLVTVTPTGAPSSSDQGKLDYYTVLRARQLSRIIDPLERIDPYLPWMVSRADEPLMGRLGRLQDEPGPDMPRSKAGAARGDEVAWIRSAPGESVTVSHVRGASPAASPGKGVPDGAQESHLRRHVGRPRAALGPRLGGRRPVPVLVVSWSYSKCPFALALPTERTEAILHGLVEAFAFFGCVPEELWWDNPATVAVQVRRGPDWRHHRLSRVRGPPAGPFCFPPFTETLSICSQDVASKIRGRRE